MKPSPQDAREELERLIAEEDDLQRALARKRKQPEPPPLHLGADLVQYGVQVRRHSGKPTYTIEREVWIQQKLENVRDKRERAERRFLDAARDAHVPRREPSRDTPAGGSTRHVCVSIIGLIPASISAIFDYRAWRDRPRPE